MMKLDIILGIPSFLAKVIKFQCNQYYLASYFKYYSIFVYLFLYTHLEEFNYLGLSTIHSNKQRKFLFDWDNSVKKKPNNEGVFTLYLHFNGHCLQNYR